MRKLHLLLLLVGTMCTKAFSADQIFPTGLTDMPILIRIPSLDKTNTHYGTGFYLSESNKIFLVTAAHCLFDIESTNRLQLKNTNATLSSPSPQRRSWILDLRQLQTNGLLKRHSHDVAVVYLGKVIRGRVDGPMRIQYAVGVSLDSSTNRNINLYDVTTTCLLSTNIPNGSETYILGYPVELLSNYVPQQVDYDLPLVRRGVVSQINPKSGKLIIDSGVYGGNSGGPVLMPEHPAIGVTKFNIIGLITEFVPVTTRVFPQAGLTNSIFVNSGYGVAEPIDYALELMRQF